MLERGDFDDLAARISHADLHATRSRAMGRDPAMILYTAGTTANPKGCVLSHEAVVRGPLHRAKHRYGTGEANVTWTALYHVGFLGPFIGSICAGGTYLTDLYFNAGRALDLMAQERATVAFPWFPATMQPMLDHPSFDLFRLSSLRFSLRSILVIGSPRGAVAHVPHKIRGADPPIAAAVARALPWSRHERAYDSVGRLESRDRCARAPGAASACSWARGA